MAILGKTYSWGDRAKYVQEKPGVYAFYDKDVALIYIGKSINLQESFAEYIETNFSNEPCKNVTKYYRREFTENPEKRMKELLEEYISP